MYVFRRIKFCYFLFSLASIIFGHPEVRGIATPILWQKFKLGIFSKFFRHRVANDQ